MNSIENVLSTEGSAKELRVKNFKKNLLAISKDKVMALVRKYNNKQNELESALDLAPSSTTDLWSNLKNVNPDSLMTQVYSIATEMAVLLKEIRVAQLTHNTLFPENLIDVSKEIDEDFLANL